MDEVARHLFVPSGVAPGAGVEVHLAHGQGARVIQPGQLIGCGLLDGPLELLDLGSVRFQELLRRGGIAQAVGVLSPGTFGLLFYADCWRQFKSDHLCQLNFDQGLKTGFVVPGCG